MLTLPSLPFAHWLVILSALVSLFGGWAYFRDTLSGKTKPNRVSWSMWALAPLTGAVAATASGANFWPTLRIYIAGFLSLAILLASFRNKHSYWKLSRFDIACGISSFLALVAWGATGSPQLAILLAITGDGFACVPTITKAWRYPETETGLNYITSFFSVLLILPAIPVWNIENAAFQLFLLLANGVLLFSVYRKQFGFA